MPVYVYTALNTRGKRVSASIEAASPELARNSLREEGFTVYEVRSPGMWEKDFNIPLFGRPGSKDLAVFCRQISSILRAGVPVATALEMMEMQVENKQLRHAVFEMKGDVEKGDTLATAMGRQKRLFPGMLISMIAAGEESGSLEDVFLQMEIYFEKARRTKSSVTKTMIYPCVLLVVMVIVMIVMMTSIVPMFTETFAETGAELPALTRGVISFSNWIGKWWWLMAIIAVVLTVGLVAFGKTDKGRHVYGYITRKIPVVKKLVVRSACASLCRMLSLLLSSGITLLESMDLAAANMANVYFEEAVRAARDLVSQGWPLNVGLRDTGLFPPLVINMIAVGESSGDLQGSAEKLADFYDQEVADQTAKVLALLEPFMILFMAFFVILIVLAIYLPMLNMTHAYDQYLN